MSEATAVRVAHVRAAERDELREACRRASWATLALFGVAPAEASRTDAVATFVAGYAAAMLAQRALTVEPAAILEHARAALAEVP